MGKIAPTIVALGKSQTDEYRTNMHKLSACLDKQAKGSVRGLYFSNLNPKEVMEWFAHYGVDTVPKTGFVATERFVIPKGVLDPTQFNHSQEYQLRQLGLPVQLKHGQLIVENDYVVCKRGDILKPQQCRLLSLWDQKQAKFRFVLHGYWFNDEFIQHNEDNKNNNEEKSITEKKEEEMEDVQTRDTEMDQMERSNAFFENLTKHNKSDMVDDDDDENEDEEEQEDGDEDSPQEKTKAVSNVDEQIIDEAFFLESEE